MLNNAFVLSGDVIADVTEGVPNEFGAAFRWRDPTLASPLDHGDTMRVPEFSSVANWSKL